jgi:hypothetical protein
MKRLFLFAFIGFVLAGSMLYADEATLINFTWLTGDLQIEKDQSGKVTRTENRQTLTDFSGVAGATFTDEEKTRMRTSLAVNNWEVTLASSSRSVQNQSLSMTREAPTKADAKSIFNPTTDAEPKVDKDNRVFADKTSTMKVGDKDVTVAKVLGVRIHFPVEAYNSYAMVKPPFEIPAYADKETIKDEAKLETETLEAEKGQGRKFDSYGVVKNVGILKQLSINVYGSNFPNALGVVIKDENGEEQILFMDYLQFDGWRTLIWNNPNYITEVRNRELKKYPLYPKSTPYIKLVGFIIYKDAAQEGGDFITYIKDVKVVYDKAVLKGDDERDIQDESLWHILQDRYEARKASELRRLGNIQVLRYLEQQKMHKDTAATTK